MKEASISLCTSVSTISRIINGEHQKYSHLKFYEKVYRMINGKAIEIKNEQTSKRS